MKKFSQNVLIVVLSIMAMAIYVNATPVSTRRKYEQKIMSEEPQSEYMKYYPDSSEYFEKRLLKVMAVGAILIILSCLCCWTCLCCRVWANCCACCKSWCCNCFCGTGDPEPEGYAWCPRNILFLMYLVACAGLAGSCFYGHLAVQDVCSGAEALFKDTSVNAGEMYGVFESLESAMTALGEDTSAIASMKTAVKSARDSVEDLNTKAKDNCASGGNVEFGSKIYFGFFCINVIWGLIAYCCKCPCPAVTTSLIGFGLVFFAWFLMTIFLGVGTLLDDTCIQLQLWDTCKSVLPLVKPASCTDGTLRLTKFLECPESSDYNTTWTQGYNQFETLNTAYAAAYGGATPQYGAPNNVLPSDYPLDKTTTVSDFANFTKNTAWRRNVYTLQSNTVTGCTPGAESLFGTAINSDCMTGTDANQCASGQTLTPPGSAVCYQKAVLVSADLMWSSSYIASCRYLNQVAVKAVLDGGSCNKLGDGFLNLFISHGMIGFFWAWIVAICLWAHKAWVHYEEDMEELDSVDAYPGVNTQMEQPYPGEAPGMQVDGKLPEEKRSAMI